MMGFVSSFAGSATLAVRARSALAGRAVAVSPSASAQVARWSMVQSKAMPFMEAPPALDGTMAGGTFFWLWRAICDLAGVGSCGIAEHVRTGRETWGSSLAVGWSSAAG